MSQFGYCPLVWMNHSRTLNNRINGLHKRALSLVCNDFLSSFSELLEKDKSVTIHHFHVWVRNYIEFGTKNMGHLTDGVKKNCVSSTIQKENSRMGPKELSMSFM